MSREKTADEILQDSIRRGGVFAWMEENQVSKLIVDFHGEGDSGSFEDYISIQPVGDKLDRIEKLRTSLEETPNSFARGQPKTLHQLILELSEEIEEQTDHGIYWYNNEGGNGQVEWLLDAVGQDGNHYKQGICLTVNRRIIEYEGDSHCIDGSILEDESDEAAA